MNTYIHNLMAALNGKPVLIRPAFVASGVSAAKEVTSFGDFAAELRALATVDVPEHIQRTQLRRDELCRAFGFQGADPGKPFAFSQGNAIIPIHGTLVNRLPYSFGFVTGYNFITSQLNAAMADPDVTRIIYDVNSNGGTVAGCQETSDAIFAANAANGGKPSIAIVDSNCYSAAYYLASGADQISVTPSGGVGSIGVVLMHVDLSTALDKIGAKVTFIHAGDHKVDGNPYEPLSDEVTSDLQATIDKMYGAFTSTVGRNRGSRFTQQAAVDSQARTYLADDALSLGLVDAVQSVPDALNNADAFTDGDQIVTDKNQNQPTAEQLAQAAADARKAERARISGIMNHAEAAGRTKLATHLANNTEMTVEEAGAILAASEKEAAAAAPAKTEDAKQENHFKNAMDNTPNPNVGGDNQGTETADQNSPKAKANRILAAQAKSTGRKVEQPAK